MTLLYIKAVLLDPISAHVITNQGFYIFSKTVSPIVNGCNLVTSVIKSVLGRNGSCTLRGRGVHMPLVFHLLSCLSRFLVQKIKICGAYILRKVTGFRVMYTMHLGGRTSTWRGVVFCSHHMPMFIL